VYFLFVDAAGYSSIVGRNPRDVAAHAFDLLRERVRERVVELARTHHCSTAALWSWRGDGGLFVFHDEEESVARNVALETGISVLETDLARLRAELATTELKGTLRIRIAVHKGPIGLSDGIETGNIHSPDINFAAHLEEATPPDYLAISEDVYRVSGPYADHFQAVGVHEGRRVYLARSAGSPADSRRAWLSTAGLDGGVWVSAYGQRPSQSEKSKLIEVAVDNVIDLGTALNTAAGYLTTTERPASYRDAVLALLRRGGTYRCVLLDPASHATELYSRLWQEDLGQKIRRSIERFSAFKERHGAAAEGLEVYQTEDFPGMAALCVDLASPAAIVLYSPYLLHVKSDAPHFERADMPHYLATAQAEGVLGTIRAAVFGAMGDRMDRLL
jgi:class 3 adenylate cyclase